MTENEFRFSQTAEIGAVALISGYSRENFVLIAPVFVVEIGDGHTLGPIGSAFAEDDELMGVVIGKRAE